MLLRQTGRSAYRSSLLAYRNPGAFIRQEAVVPAGNRYPRAVKGGKAMQALMRGVTSRIELACDFGSRCKPPYLSLLIRHRSP